VGTERRYRRISERHSVGFRGEVQHLIGISANGILAYMFTICALRECESTPMCSSSTEESDHALL
jgi:hypothetical protein